eukprot:TRINITY_DN35025_c0_g1_i1.p1 TRINITY_DN35025_c0_g1~~TRINITY_DN35025_c0_g1_i1.p1  ORF type:complete len:795 (+),score=132.58 TRINITY_DN35025_c0_g1_i1:115-2499(+)
MSVLPGALAALPAPPVASGAATPVRHPSEPVVGGSRTVSPVRLQSGTPSAPVLGGGSLLQRFAEASSSHTLRPASRLLAPGDVPTGVFPLSRTGSVVHTPRSPPPPSSLSMIHQFTPRQTGPRLLQAHHTSAPRTVSPACSMRSGSSSRGPSFSVRMLGEPLRRATSPGPVLVRRPIAPSPLLTATYQCQPSWPSRASLPVACLASEVRTSNDVAALTNQEAALWQQVRGLVGSLSQAATELARVEDQLQQLRRAAAAAAAGGDAAANGVPVRRAGADVAQQAVVWQSVVECACPQPAPSLAQSYGALPRSLSLPPQANLFLPQPSSFGLDHNAGHAMLQRSDSTRLELCSSSTGTGLHAAPTWAWPAARPDGINSSSSLRAASASREEADGTLVAVAPGGVESAGDQVFRDILSEVEAVYPVSLLMDKVADELLQDPPPALAAGQWTASSLKRHLTALVSDAAAASVGPGRTRRLFGSGFALLDALAGQAAWSAFERAMRHACEGCGVVEALCTRLLAAVRVTLALQRSQTAGKLTNGDGLGDSWWTAERLSTSTKAVHERAAGHPQVPPLRTAAAASIAQLQEMHPPREDFETALEAAAAQLAAERVAPITPRVKVQITEPEASMGARHEETIASTASTLVGDSPRANGDREPRGHEAAHGYASGRTLQPPRSGRGGEATERMSASSRASSPRAGPYPPASSKPLKALSSLPPGNMQLVSALRKARRWPQNQSLSAERTNAASPTARAPAAAAQRAGQAQAKSASSRPNSSLPNRSQSPSKQRAASKARPSK